MANDTPPWMIYLNDKTGPTGVPTYRRSESTFVGGEALTPYDITQRQEQASSIGSEFIAGKPQTGQADPGLLSRAIRAITFLPSVATSAVKEFVSDPFVNLLVPGTVDKVSIKEFKDNVNNRRFAQEQYSYLNYDKDAPLWEKALKQAAGFGVDVLSTGGFGGGLKVASVVGRKVSSMTVQNAARDAFVRAAKQLPGETTDDFISRGGQAAQAALRGETQLAAEASDFGAKAALAFSRDRSRGVANLFDDAFGNGKDMFFSLPREVQGGLQVRAFGKTLANWNSGGYLTDGIARGLGLPQLSDTTAKAVRTFQNIKNSARADRISTPVVSTVLSGINNILNKVGVESQSWQKYLQTMVDNADEEDSIRAFKSFSEGVRTVQNLRNIRMGFVQSTKDFLRDIGQLEKAAPDTYARAIAFMKDPASMAAADVADDSVRIARNFAEIHRAEYDYYYKQLIDSGFDVGYLENYIPLMYVRPEVQDQIAKVLEAGPRGIPGPGYRPEMARKAFMKDKIDPNTKQPVLDADGQIVKEPMTPTEVKKELTDRGRKDLADLIEDDPLLQLAQYSTNISRLLSNKKVIADLVKQGVLVRSGTLQADFDPARIESIVARFDPKRLDQEIKTVFTTPGKLGEYLTKLNDDLALAARTEDEALRQSVNDRMEFLLNSFGTFDKKLSYQLKKAAEKADEVELAKIKEEKLYLQQRQVALGATGKRAKAEPANLAEDLAQREGIEYRQIGGTETTAGETFYLPPEFAGLAGEKSLVEAVERKMLLRNNDKEALAEVMKSVDAYTQFFRTSATFGKLTGFVLRNGYGAVQNNYVIANSTAKDHIMAADIARIRVMTDFALGPLGQLTRADLSTKRVDKLVRDGRLTADQAKLLKDDILNTGRVQTSTISTIRDEVLEGLMSKKRINDTTTYWDAYKTALDEGDVYDRYTILPAMQGLNAEDERIVMLGVDPDRIVVRTDRVGSERKLAQKGMEFVQNFGVGPDTKLIGNVFSADVAGRNIVIRPTQNTRDFNQLMEEVVRTAPIITGLRKYGNTEGGRKSAALLMKAAQFDYSNLTDFERNVLRRALPFYTYTRNNVPAQLRALMNDPTRVQRNLQFWDAVSNVFADDQGNNIVVPSYIGQMYGFAVNEDYRKELMKDKPAWLQAILANPIAFRPESPVLDIEKYTLGGMGPGGILPGAPAAEQILSSINPLAKGVLQAALGQNLYTKRRYTDDGTPAPSWAQALDTGLRKVSNGKLQIGVTRDPDTGDFMMPDAVYDFIKTTIPTTGTIDRTFLPAIEIISGAMGGGQEKLTSAEERAVTNLLSTFGGVNLITLTEKTQQAELYNRIQNRKESINMIADQQRIDPSKVNSYVNQLIKNGLDPVEDKAAIMVELDLARQQGIFTPDYLLNVSGTQG